MAGVARSVSQSAINEKLNGNKDGDH